MYLSRRGIRFFFLVLLAGIVTTPVYAKYMDEVTLSMLQTKVRRERDLKHFKVTWVRPTGIAGNALQVNDLIIGIGSNPFGTYPAPPGISASSLTKYFRGVDPFPELAEAVEAAQASASGKLELLIERGGQQLTVSCVLGKQPAFSPTFPFSCPRSMDFAEAIADDCALKIEDYITTNQPYYLGTDTLSGLLLLNMGYAKYKKTLDMYAKAVVEWVIDDTANWGVAYSTMFLSEYYLQAGRPAWVRNKLFEFRDYIQQGQFEYGGWGHGYRGGNYGHSGLGVMTANMTLALYHLVYAGIPVSEEFLQSHLAHAVSLVGSAGDVSYKGVSPERASLAPFDLNACLAVNNPEWMNSHARCAILGMGFLAGGVEKDRTRGIAHRVWRGRYQTSDPHGHCQAMSHVFSTLLLASQDPAEFRDFMDFWKFRYVLSQKISGSFDYWGMEAFNDFRGPKGDGLYGKAGCGLVMSMEKKNILLTKFVLDGVSKGRTSWIARPTMKGRANNPVAVNNGNTVLFYGPTPSGEPNGLWALDKGASAPRYLFEYAGSCQPANRYFGGAGVRFTTGYVEDTGKNGTGTHGGLELLVTDGTLSGSWIKEIAPQYGDTRGGPRDSKPREFKEINGKVYFLANTYIPDTVNANRVGHTRVAIELWESDGTLAGTKLIKHDLLFSQMLQQYDEVWLNESQGKLFIAEYDTYHVNGWNPSTVRCYDPASGKWTDLTDIANIGSFRTFVADVPGGTVFNRDDKLWFTDGTKAGTKEIYSNKLTPGSGVGTNTGCVFFANDGALKAGVEVWFTDGKTASMIKDIKPGGGSGCIAFPNDDSKKPIYMGGYVYFLANDGTTGDELWRTDGTAANTELVRDINPGMESSWISSLHVHKGELFFTATNGVSGVELWKTDGTEAGTVFLDIVPGGAGSLPRDIVSFGDDLFVTFMGIEPTYAVISTSSSSKQYGGWFYDAPPPSSGSGGGDGGGGCVIGTPSENVALVLAALVAGLLGLAFVRKTRLRTRAFAGRKGS